MYALFLMVTVIFCSSYTTVDNSLSEGKSGLLTVEKISKMSVKEYAAIKGSKLSVKEKLVLKITQRELRKEIKAGNISKDQVVDVKKKMDGEMPKFNLGGFALGFLLGLIGVGLAHIFSNNKSFRRSSWYGLGAWVIVLLILLLV